MNMQARSLKFFLAVGLLFVASSWPAAAQDPAVYYQLTNYTEIWDTQYHPPTASSGNGQKVAFPRQGIVYLGNSDGSDTPQQIGVGGRAYISYDGSQVLSAIDRSDGYQSLYLNGTEISLCKSHPQLHDVCLQVPHWYSTALSGNGQYVFLISSSKWGCEPKQNDYGGWYWDCALPAEVPRIWRLPTAGGEPELWQDSVSVSFGADNDIRTNYAGTMLAWAGRAHGTAIPEVYVGYGDNQQKRIFVGEYIPLTDLKIVVSADGRWVAYAIDSRSCSGEHHQMHIFRSDGSGHTTLDPLPFPAVYSYSPMGFSEDGERLLFESDTLCFDSHYRAFLVNRDGSNLVPILSNTTFESQASSLSYDGQSVAFTSASDILGNGNEYEQAFVLKGPAKPDLDVDAFALNTTAATYSSGRYTYPLDITVRNTGLAPAADFQVRFSDNGGWRETRAIASLAPGASTVLHLDWDLTNLLDAGQGRAKVQLTVTADPDDVIVEASNLNNTAWAATDVDARPRLTQVQSGYRPGAFLAGVSLSNNFDVWVDWNGDLGGSGAPGEPEQVTYELNGTPVVEPVSNPAAAPAASHSYDMGSDLQAGTNVLNIQARNDAGFESDLHTLTLQRADNAAWLASVAVDVEAEPPGAPYDKIAVYKSTFEWPNETLEAYFDVPADQVSILQQEYGPSIDAWSIEVEFRSDGAGSLTGSGEFEGEIKGTAALKATITALGAVRAAEQLRLTKLEGSLRGEGDISTPRVPLNPWLPFLYAQAKIGAGADATLGVYEQASGELEWSPLVLGLDATVEGTLSSGVEGVAYVEGGVGGQPRGEFNLPPDPDLLRSLTVRLYAWGKAQFLIWEKGYEAEYEYVVAGPAGHSAYTYAPEPRTTGWRLREPPADIQAPNASGPLAMDYAYADPALAMAGDDTMTLVWVDDEATQLEIRASRWDGAAWNATADLTDNAFLDAHPTVAYDGAGNAVALWTQLPDATPPVDPHDALADMEIMSAAWDGMAWSAPARLTNDAQMDGRPKVAADSDGNLMATWLKDADGSFPLYPDEETETLGGDLYYALWDGVAWSAPALAVSGVASDEAPQLARAGDMALTVWSHDADGSVGTLTDTAIYYATWLSPTWGAAQALAGVDDGVADLSPRIAYDAAGRASLVWVKGRVAQSAGPDDVVDQLYFATYSGGAWSAPVVALEASAIEAPQLLVDSSDNLVVLWLARSDAGVDVWYAVYDRDAALWSDPLLLTHDADAATDYDAVLDSSDTLRLVLTGREVVTATHEAAAARAAAPSTAQAIVYPAFGAVRSAEHQHTLGHDLTLTELAISPANPAPGTTAVLTATALNSGDLAVTGATVAFYDGDPDGGGTQIGAAQTTPSPFRAGATATATVQWNVPAGMAAHTLYAVIDPDSAIPESDEENNRISLPAVLPDLEVEWARTDWRGDAITITASVRNAGVSGVATPFIVALRADDPLDGAELAAETVSAPLLPGESLALELTLATPAAALTGTHTAWVVADAGEAVAEADETNNTAFSALNINPDLTLTAADMAGNGPVMITVHNTGLITATDVLVTVRQGGIGGPLLYSGTLASLAAGGTDTITLTLPPGEYTLYVHLDPANSIEENDESNNLAVRPIGIPWRAYLPLVVRSDSG